jgi:Holliday junction resolvasome RuvABC DNA-binding subunit
MNKNLEVKADKFMVIIEDLKDAMDSIDNKIHVIHDKQLHRDSGCLTEKEEERIEALESLRYSIEEAKEWLKEKIDEAVESLED